MSVPATLFGLAGRVSFIVFHIGMQICSMPRNGQKICRNAAVMGCLLRGFDCGMFLVGRGRFGLRPFANGKNDFEK